MMQPTIITLPISYDIKGLAEDTGMTESHIREAIKDGLLKASVKGNKYIIPRKEAERYVSTQ